MCWLLFLVQAPHRDRRRTVAVLVVAEFDVLVAAAVAAVFLPLTCLLLFVCLLFPEVMRS